MANGEDAAQFSTVDMSMAGERAPTDPIAMERARARIERALFGQAPPARLARYVVLDAVAGGGMGMVYAAYDPELDRKVALKVLHPSRAHQDNAHERLLQEARALARLDHPNVVKVHDVLAHDGQIVVVMTLLDGETLAAWEAAPHPWRDVVAAYLQAGEGLAAAHSVDVIHRDFKPSNAIIRSSGEVQVLDFGLARVTTDGDGGPGAGPVVRGNALTGRTISGAFVGTPAYAAPEQLAGEPSTASSDQFSFCVALHHALEGVFPFPGRSIAELTASIRHGRLRGSSDRHVPAWLRHIVRRGLSWDPAQRFESMPALLADMRRPRGWKRWRWPASTTALVVGASVIVAWIGNATETGTVCDGGAAKLSGVWDFARRAELAGHLSAVADGDARDLEVRVVAGLDAESWSWRRVHLEACQAHRRGEESDRLLDLKMRCLDRQRGDIAAGVAVLQQTTRATVARAIDVVVGLPPPAWCGDPARVSEDADPPATAALDQRVQQVRAQLSRAAALDHNGRSDEAAATARAAIRDAELTTYRPVIAEAELELGRILIGRGDVIAAEPVLQKAAETALATGRLPRLAVEAGARLIYAEGAHIPNLDRLRRDLQYLLPMSQALAGDRFVRPLLLNNAGEVYQFAKQLDEARRYFALAHDALGGDAADIELTVIDRNLATLTPDPAARLQLAHGAWARTRSVLGAHHLRTLRAQTQYALLHAGAPAAYELLSPVCDEYQHSYAALVGLIVDCEFVRGYLASELDRIGDARRAYDAIVANTASSSDPDRILFHQLAEAELAMLDHQFDRAVPRYQAVIAALGTSELWWQQQFALQAELGLGIAALAQHRSREAVAHLEAAAKGYGDIVRTYPAAMYLLRLARAQDLLAASR
jgi:hypothetical protein